MTTVERPHHVPLRSSSSQSQETPTNADLVEETLKSEEERILHEDEEITSVEDNAGDEPNDLDDEMLNLAIANSVADRGSALQGRGGSNANIAAATSDVADAKEQSALGKRQHSRDDVAHRLDDAKKRRSDGGGALKADPDVAVPDDDGGHADTPLVQNQSQDAKLKSSEPSANRAKGDGASPLFSSSSVRIKVEHDDGVQKQRSENRGAASDAYNPGGSRAPQQHPASVSAVSKGAIVPVARPPNPMRPPATASAGISHASTNQLPVVPRSAAPLTRVSVASLGATHTGASRSIPMKIVPPPVKRQSQQTSILPPTFSQHRFAPTSGAVPNPLLQTIPSSVLSAPPRAPAAVPIPVLSRPPSTTVPCPLPANVPCPLTSASSASAKASTESMPPPLVKMETESSLPPPQPRERAFSVDLDPSIFDFSGMGADASGPDRQGSSNVGNDLSAGATEQRDRSFSFEFFNFASEELMSPGIEPSLSTTTYGIDIPPVANPSTVPGARRPRGDSIIFDPISFQDGGIHETNALSKVRSPGQDPPLESKQPETHTSSVSSAATTQPPTTTSSVLGHVTSYNAASAPTSATVPVAQPKAHASQVLSASASAALSESLASSSSSTSLQLDLLNKDGRIGIYLPEERKARIARFHSKRKMRIWRKRIKYDCRKKLADSRPRIKGRFVKRSDVDEE